MKNIFNTLVILAVIAYCTVFYLLNHLKPDTVRDMLVKTLDSNIGLKISLGSEFSLSSDLLLSPTLKLSNVKIKNVDWGKNQNFAEIERLTLSLGLRSLLHGAIRITTLTLEQPKIFLETNAQNQNNWDILFHNKKESTPSSNLSSAIQIGEIKITEAILERRTPDELAHYEIKQFSTQTNALGQLKSIEAKLKINNKVYALQSALDHTDAVWTLSPLSITHRQNTLQGSLILQSDHPHITGEFQTTNWEVPAPSPTATQKKKATRFFPELPLPLEMLKKKSGSLDVKIKNFKYHRVLINNFHLSAKLKNGLLSIKLPQATLADGSLDVNVDLNSQESLPVMKLNALIKDMSLEKLTEQLYDRKVISNGMSELTLNASGQGKSLNEILGTLEGKFLFVVQPAQLNRSFDEMGHSLILSTVKAINPFEKKSNYTNFSCAVFNFNIRQGVASANRGLAAETEKFTIVANGKINLKTEKIQFDFTPTERSKFKLPVGAAMNFVQLTGTLSNPKVGLNPKDILKEGGALVATFATHGLSHIAQSLIQNATEDKHPCQTALRK